MNSPKQSQQPVDIDITGGGRPVFIDIDGTLTTTSTKPWGEPISDRMDAVRTLIANGCNVVLWSGGGTAYARAFAEFYDLAGATCLGKPDLIVDDNPKIRPRLESKVMSPEEFFGS